MQYNNKKMNINISIDFFCIIIKNEYYWLKDLKYIIIKYE